MSAEFIAVIGAIATVLAGFGGATLGACFAYKTGIKLIQEAHKNNIELFRRQEFNRTTAIFRSTFVDVIYRLRKNIETGDVYLSEIIADNILIAHEKAKIMFEPFVIVSKRESFGEAWEKYKNTQNEYIKSVGATFNPSRISDKKGLSSHYLSNIDNLLSFAKPFT